MAFAPSSLVARVFGVPLTLAVLTVSAQALGATPAPAAAATPHHGVRHVVPRRTVAPPTASAVQPELSTPQAAPIAPAPAPVTRMAHDVPDPESNDAMEVPIAWVVGDGRPKHRPQVPSLTMGIWPDSFTLAAWWAAPVLPRGFIRNVNDSLDLEFGFILGAMRDGYYWNDAATSWQLWPAVGVKWNFFLTRNWTTFATLKLAGRIPLAGPHPGWFDILLGAGATYRIKERMHLRLELNYPQGAVVGLSFPIGAL